jgi:hypothetical protein
VQPVSAAKARTAGRDARGLFQKGNRAAAGQALKVAIKRGFGDTKGDTPQARTALATSVLNKALLRDLPAVDANVRLVVAGQARAAVMAQHVTQSAMQAGVETPAGQKLLELAAKYEQQSLRAGVVAADLSSKLHAAQPRPNPWWSGGSDGDDDTEQAPDDAQDSAEPTSPDVEPADASQGILDGTAEGDS